MTDKELRALGRKELLQMLLEQSKELQALQEKYDAAQAALQDRSIKLDRAGSIAEASLQLNGLFEAAQAACQQYTDSITALSQRQESICAQMEADSRAKADAILAEAQQQKADTEAQCAQLLHTTQAQCEEMTAAAEAQSQSYWKEVFRRLQAYAAEHAELRELLSVVAASGKGAQQ